MSLVDIFKDRVLGAAAIGRWFQERIWNNMYSWKTNVLHALSILFSGDDCIKVEYVLEKGSIEFTRDGNK